MKIYYDKISFNKSSETYYLNYLKLTYYYFGIFIDKVFFLSYFRPNQSRHVMG
jgi:hypothetical protein